jgi:YbbR domain-containing protein
MSVKSVFANLQWKILALVIAVALWSAILGEPELVTSQSVPVFYKNLPRDLQIGSDVPDRVHLEIRGAAGKLAPGELAQTAVLVDLTSVNGPVEKTVTITGDSINLPQGVQLLRAVPSQLRLRFEKTLTREVPVQLRSGSPPPAGYRVASQQVVPEKLKVTGPESRVQLLESAQTDPIDLSSIVGQSEFRVHAYITDPQVRFEGSPVVTVRVNVLKTAVSSR